MARRGRRTKAPATLRTLDIDRLGRSGDGLSGDIAVPFTLPGETVTAKVAARKGRVERIEAASPLRAAPPCRHFGLPGDGCGGCRMQHLRPDDYAQWKRDRLTSALGRVLGEVPTPAAYASPPRSRRRAKLAFFRTRSGVQVGFRRLGDERVVAIEECHVLTPELFELAHALRPLIGVLPESRGVVEAMVTMTAAGPDVDVTSADEPALPLPAREALSRMAEALDLARLSLGGVALVERRTPAIGLGGLEVALPAGAFLQATREGEAQLQGLVLDGAGEAERVADLFCGVGTFALPLSQRARVYAAEGDRQAVDALKAAARRGGRKVEAEARDLFTRPLLGKELDAFDAVVLDPPRAGAAEQCEALARSAVPRIVYVSCNPDALARDARTLSGCYNLTRLSLVDQFLWSPHIEAVAIFERRE
ncbi:class I SAM-dependent RNA methyltransferase [Parvularcula oceani]|uniref:class I SAM-dependent RNA methyltransferase n=1 Tax=Parvularcula oceani TaxID=1247963 RepID=UPI00068E55B0|nr:class I SAM-dependent RNA methyltransferase [Parvularcula oceani]